MRVVGNLPQVAVGIFEVAAVAAPEYFLRFLDQGCSCRQGLVHHFINLRFRRDIVRQGESGKARTFRRNRSILSQRFPSVQSQPGAVESKESHLRRGFRLVAISSG